MKCSPKRPKILFLQPAFICLLMVTAPLGCLGRPPVKESGMQEVDFFKLNSSSYVTKSLQDYEAHQRNLSQGNGERANTLIRLAQICNILGELVDGEHRLAYYEKGKDYAELLIKENPVWADGHYWKAINLCGVAEVGGAGRALRLLPEIVEAMEKAAAVDPTIDQAGPHRVLGRIFSEAPAWPISVGDINKSLQHLTLAVQIAPNNTTNHLYLAETLLRLNKHQEARVELDKVFRSTQHAMWPLGVEQDRCEARLMLAKLKKSP